MEVLAELTRFLLAQDADKNVHQHQVLAALLQCLVLLFKSSTENQDLLKCHLQIVKDLIQVVHLSLPKKYFWYVKEMHVFSLYCTNIQR